MTMNAQDYSRNNVPKIYVACLESYNNGILRGDWISLDLDYEYIQEGIRDILYYSESKEWAIHDYECFGDYRVEEWSDLQEVYDIAQVILHEPHGELIISVMEHLGSGTSLEYAKEFLENNYEGIHKDLGEYAYNYCETCSDLSAIPEYISCHIDFDAMGRDWDYSGDIFTISEGREIHVFRNR